MEHLLNDKKIIFVPKRKIGQNLGQWQKELSKFLALNFDGKISLKQKDLNSEEQMLEELFEEQELNYKQLKEL